MPDAPWLNFTQQKWLIESLIAVSKYGGRGYRRDNAVERFFREVRVDRIWEGSSEMQRMVIARALQKRGLKGM